jgi:transcriptional regulator with XRE-family HTH domain
VTPHDEMIATWKEDPTFRKEYDALAEEFALFDALVSARQQAGLTQMEVAERMGTKTPAVARLEAGGGRQHHAPSLATLRKYAAAVGCRLEVKLVPLSTAPRQEREKPSRHKRPKQKPSRSPAQCDTPSRT